VGVAARAGAFIGADAVSVSALDADGDVIETMELFSGP